MASDATRDRNTIDALDGSQPRGRFVRGVVREQETLGDDPFAIAWTAQVIAWAMRYPEQAQYWSGYLLGRQIQMAPDVEPSEIVEQNERALARLAERWAIADVEAAP